MTQEAEKEIHDIFCSMLLGRTLATAESCTGGLIAHRLTSVAGSSAYYVGSVVSYTNQIKQNVLGVSEADIAAHSEVSNTVACQMAEGVRRLMQTDYAVSTTGYAGPTGGTSAQPVGTVWIGISTPKCTHAEKHFFSGDRMNVVQAAAEKALRLLIDEIANRQ